MNCPYCEETFDTLEQLNTHITDEHPGEPLVSPAPVQEPKANWKLMLISAGFLALACIILGSSKKEEQGEAAASGSKPEEEKETEKE